jgi:hypothetical protein
MELRLWNVTKRQANILLHCTIGSRKRSSKPRPQSIIAPRQEQEVQQKWHVNRRVVYLVLNFDRHESLIVNGHSISSVGGTWKLSWDFIEHISRWATKQGACERGYVLTPVAEQLHHSRSYHLHGYNLPTFAAIALARRQLHLPLLDVQGSNLFHHGHGNSRGSWCKYWIFTYFCHVEYDIKKNY